MIYIITNNTTGEFFEKEFGCHEEAERYVANDLKLEMKVKVVNETHSDFRPLLEFPWAKHLPTVTGR
jgi:hypothetical protein